jgi:hypothetical protein
LHSSWKGVVATKLQLNCNELHHMSSNFCNSCNLFDSTHDVEILWVANGHCNSKIELQVVIATQKLSCKANYKTPIFLIVNETYPYSIKYKVQNRRYWKGWTTKTLLFDFIELDEMYTCIFAIAWSFVNPHVVHICLLLLVTCHHQGIIALLSMLVCITI